MSRQLLLYDYLSIPITTDWSISMIDKSYTKCYIAFLDILGFKEIIAEKACEEIYTIFSTKMKKPISGISMGTRSVLNMKEIKMKVMSDSICFYVDSKIRNALYGLLATCASFQVELLKMKEPILSRGAIVCGDIYADGDVIYGPGFVQAYQMEEHKAKFPRIIMDGAIVHEALKETDEDVIHHMCTMVECDFDGFHYIDYLEEFEGFDIEDEDCQHLLAHINNVLNTDMDISIRLKYLYLEKKLLRWYKPKK